MLNHNKEGFRKGTLISWLKWILALGFLVGSLLPAGSLPAQAEVNNDIHIPLILKNYLTGNGAVDGRVLNATNGEGVVGAKVCVGPVCTLAVENGAYLLPEVPNYLANGIASASGFYTSTQPIPVIAGQTVTKNFTLSPPVSANDAKLRFVLTWVANPSWPGDPNPINNDLDVILWLKAPQSATIYETVTERCRQYPYVCKEVDVQTGYGPESILVRELQVAGTYYVGVWNYTQQYGAPNITQTAAKLDLYDEAGLNETMEIPTTGTGDFWLAFSMDDQGNRTPINCFADFDGNTNDDLSGLNNILTQCGITPP